MKPFFVETFIQFSERQWSRNFSENELTFPEKTIYEKNTNSTCVSKIVYLIFVDFSVLEFRLALFLESDDNQGDEDVDEEKGEDDEENDVENGHFDAEQRDRAFVFVRRRHGMLQHAEVKTPLLKLFP